MEIPVSLKKIFCDRESFQRTQRYRHRLLFLRLFFQEFIL